MDRVLKLTVMGRAARNAANVKNRQPLAKMLVKAPYTLHEYFTQVLLDELNIKEAEFTEDVSAYTTYLFKPQLRTVGPKYGKLLGKIRTALTELDGNAAMKELKESGALHFDFDGAEVVLAEEDLLIEMSEQEGFKSETDGQETVVLDLHLTDALLEEGFVRELVSKIQTMRKEADFNVTDRIKVYVSGNEKIKKIMDDNADEIKRVVLGDDFIDGTAGENSKEWNINGEKVTLGVERV